MLNAFEFDYERGDVRSGIGYTIMLTNCIEGAADRKETVDVLLKWAQGDVTDTRNPLLRAFVLNDPVLGEKVKEASSYPYRELREAVAKLIESYSNVAYVTKHANQGLAAALSGSFARLLHEVGGPLVEVITKNVDAVAAKVIYATMCVRTGKVFEVKPVYGSPNQWISYIARQMQVMLPGRQQADVQDLQKALQRRAAPAGGEKDWEVKAKQFVPVETLPDEAAAMAGMKPRPGVSAKMMAATLTPDVVEKIYMPKFRLFARGEPAYAGIGAIFNAINLRFAREELKKSNHFNSTENTIKFDNAAGGLVASVSQYGHRSIESIEKSGAKIGEGWVKLGKAMEMVGKLGGAVVGLVSAAIDGYHAWDELQHGNYLLATLFTLSGFLGIALVWAAFSGPVLALPLLVIAAILGVVINYFKGREINDWLEQCYFGIKEAKERFQSLAEDQKALASVIS